MVAATYFSGRKPTKRQEEILNLYKEGNNMNSIATLLEITRQAVKKHILALEKKGCLNRLPKKGLPMQCNHWRVHGLHLVATPYYYTDNYTNYRERYGGAGVRYREWLIFLHNGSVEFRQRKDHEFKGRDKYGALRKASDSFRRNLKESGERFGYRVIKDKKANIRAVRGHLVRSDSDLSKATREYINIRGEYDNKVWFQIDKSKAGFDHEYTQIASQLNDSDAIEPVLNDYRAGIPRPSEVYKILTESLKLQHEHAASIAIILKNLEPPKAQNGLDKRLRPDYVG